MKPAAGDILRARWPDAERAVPLYLGTGRMGGCFNAWGLQDAEPAAVNPRVGRTVLMHRELWSHGRFGIDHHVPFARLRWAHEPPRPEKFEQHFSLETGVIHVLAQSPGFRWECRVATAPAEGFRDVMEWEIAWSGRLPDVRFAPVLAHRTSYGEDLRGGLSEMETSPAGWRARWRLGTADGFLHLGLNVSSGRAALSGDENGCAVSFSSRNGKLTLRLVAGAWPRRDELFRFASRPGDLARSGATSWRTLWRRTAAVSAPTPESAALTERSVSYFLSTFEPAAQCPLPPTGFGCNEWGYHFPQDVSYMHPALLRLGHTDLARGIVEFYASRIAQMEEFTRRIWNVPGTFWAWEFPIGADTRPLLDGTPNPFQFELHNAAYPARMAWETAQALGDREWLRTVAWPVIFGSAFFYTSLLKRGRDGLWGIHVTPSMGQDEYGGENSPDYLCALFAADYTLRIALRAASRAGLRPKEATAWRKILADGLAFPRLLDRAHGIYATSGGQRLEFGKTKHPVQLGPVTFLPGARPWDAPTRRALARRDELASSHRASMAHGGVRGSFYDGWTLSALWLADARAGETDALLAHLREAPVAQYVDVEWVQIYESSGFWHPYYLTSHGLFLQAMLALKPAS